MCSNDHLKGMIEAQNESFEAHVAEEMEEFKELRASIAENTRLIRRMDEILRGNGEDGLKSMVKDLIDWRKKAEPKVDRIDTIEAYFTDIKDGINKVTIAVYIAVGTGIIAILFGIAQNMIGG